ncbi:MAG: hypothetical protein KDA66_04430 [Planctomycetaceae bacterium]|nr:hypothetical protein [Planctomycetaceae bacterium]
MDEQGTNGDIASEDANEQAWIRNVARKQRYVLIAFSSYYACCLVGALEPMVPAGVRQIFWPCVMTLFVFCLIGAAVAAVLLARELYNWPMVIVVALLMLHPCSSVVALALVNQHATTFLQTRGIRVGLFGAKLDNTE